MAASHYDAITATLQSRVFSSTEVYRDEVERIFNRAWLLVAPLSWLAERGDYVATTLGPTPILAWRGADGSVGLFHDRCVAGNSAISREARGRASTLMCPCHGWPYAPVAGPDALRPASAGIVEDLDGLLFGSQDRNAPALRDWLGEFVWCWQRIVDRYPGGIEIYGGASLNTRVACNWKFAAEAYAGDVYCDRLLTRATREVLELGRALVDREGFQIAAGAGAMAMLTDEKAHLDDFVPALGTCFPNLSYDGRASALHIWHPRGPLETEVQTFCLVGRSEAPEIREARRRNCQLLCGPAGLLMQDYASAWEGGTRATRHARSHTLNLQMGQGRERKTNLPGRVSDLASEMNQRAFYQWWQSQLARPPSSPARSRIAVGVIAARDSIGEVE